MYADTNVLCHQQKYIFDPDLISDNSFVVQKE